MTGRSYFEVSACSFATKGKANKASNQTDRVFVPAHKKQMSRLCAEAHTH